MPPVTPKALQSFTVRARLPEALAPLEELAMNLRWSWDSRTRDLFRWVDPDFPDEASVNPIKMLWRVSRQRLESLSQDPGFMEFLAEVHNDFRRYMTTDRWFQHRNSPLRSVAYFSPEFGLCEGFPQYSGGLGVLAGDHIKAGSGLGLPIVGVGLFYQQGYFRQELDADGWQMERYPILDPHAMALTLEPHRIEVNLAGEPLVAQIWRVEVGRARLYLLCSDVEENAPRMRMVTDRLYSGDEEHRIEQEILLGVGGIRALEAVGETPQIFHMNEGHAGFLGLERVRRFIMEEGLTFDEAVEASRASTAFTTHTPVAAGIHKFSRTLMERYFKSWGEECDVSFNQLMALGQEPGADDQSPFNMAVMCLRLSSYTNGVSKLHGRVSRLMFQTLWPDVPVEEVPISSVTNGVHARSWVSTGMSELFDRYVLPEWAEAGDERWSHIESARDDELWRVKEHAREQLVLAIRRQLRESLFKSDSEGLDLEWADNVLDPRILTIGFARRFAGYKRPTLLFGHRERLRKLLLSADRPIQLVFAGKAHPDDDAGKKMIQKVVEFSRDPEIRHRVVFLPDYDMASARLLCQGADVWLNTPRRPLEASGTSGQKAALNGGLNLSIRDGWWDEMYDGHNGWAILSAENYLDLDRRDKVEAASLFELLEREIVPRFYDRQDGAVPREWVRMVKYSLKSLGPKVNATRMLRDYLAQIYEPLAVRRDNLYGEDYQRARSLANWKARVCRGWEKVSILGIDADASTVSVRDSREVEAVVHLGDLDKGDVAVQLVHGPVGEGDELYDTHAVPMTFFGTDSDRGGYRYKGSFTCEAAGRYGFTVRVVPAHKHLVSFSELGCITWA
ncbi:MAG TPA: alpha-glucan family phosphorylase [Actinomycetota bacterium]|nr:alpha-glucan family phosphorylase [Actinomycetota bacterium]